MSQSNRAMPPAQAWFGLGAFWFGAALSLGAMQSLGSPGSIPEPGPSTPNIRTLDGRFNHPWIPELGAAGRPYRRLAPAADGLQRPHPRRVSNRLQAESHPHRGRPDPAGSTLLFAAFGQFVSHDITLRAKAARPDFIRVPPGDPMFPDGCAIPVLPGLRHPQTGQAYNRVTAWIDASMVYGSDPLRAQALRSFEGGRLRVSEGGQLPRVGQDFEQSECVSPWERLSICAPLPENDNPRRESPGSLYLAGDVRANENPLLLSLHTIFLREHNRRADAMRELHPSWTDEDLYQDARRWVGALVQALTYREYLPRLLGQTFREDVPVYRPSAAADISVEFASAAFRFGHSQLGPTLYRRQPDGSEFPNSHVSLKAAFFAPPLYGQAGGGPGAWLLGAATASAQPIDLVVIDDLRNYMFGSIRGGLDIAAINVQVGRDQRVAGLDAIRRRLGMPPLAGFDALTADEGLRRRLKEVYGDWVALDPWVGMLAEDRPHDGSAGLVPPTLGAILAEQFRALRDGDRFHFEWDTGLSESERQVLRATRLSQVIRRNLRGPYRNAEFPEDVFQSSRGFD